MADTQIQFRQRLSSYDDVVRRHDIRRLARVSRKKFYILSFETKTLETHSAIGPNSITQSSKSQSNQRRILVLSPFF